jgi:hypothetical protein
MNFGKIAERSFTNVLAVVIIGQIPPFTTLPEELLSVPMAIGLGVVGVDIPKSIKKVI